MSVTLDKARTIISHAMAAGREHNMMPLTVAVLDAGGHLVALEREDGSGIMRVEIAFGKAWGSIGMGQPSRVLRDRLTNRPHFIAALTDVSSGRFVPVPGGVLIEAGGSIIGAVGVSGDTSEKDEFAAITGIKAAGLACRPDEPDPNWQGSSL